MLKEIVLGIGTLGILSLSSCSLVESSFSNKISLVKTQFGETIFEKESEDNNFYLVGKDLNSDGMTDITVYYLNCGDIGKSLKKPLGLLDSFGNHWSYQGNYFIEGIATEPYYENCD